MYKPQAHLRHNIVHAEVAMRSPRQQPLTSEPGSNRHVNHRASPVRAKRSASDGAATASQLAQDGSPASATDGMEQASLLEHNSSGVHADESELGEAPQHEGPPAPRLSRSLRGQLTILMAALLWGTSAPAMRYLYRQGEGLAPTPSVVAAIQTLAGAACLMGLMVILPDSASGQQPAKLPQRGESEQDPELGSSPAAGTDPIPEESMERGRAQHKAGTAAQSGLLQRLGGVVGEDLRLAGGELGVWAFLANAATVVGFNTTSVVRGAFLVRLSAMFTPLIAAAGGERFTLPVWLGCSAALVGGVLIALDTSGDPSAATSGASWGDFMIVIAAALWSMQTVRLGVHAPKFPALRLATYQLSTMGVLSGLWAAGEWAVRTHNGDHTSLWGGSSSVKNWVVMLIPAVGPWSIGTALQMRGQVDVSAPIAMIVLATDPIWAAVFAGLVDSSEQHLGAIGVLGAVCIFSASVIASLGNAPRH